MNTTRTYKPSVAVMTAIAATMFIATLELAYFVTCIASMAFAIGQWTLETIIIVFSCAAVPTFWSAYRLHREYRHHDQTASPTKLLARQLWAFVICLRVPATLILSGIIARAVGTSAEWFFVLAAPIGIFAPAIIYWWLHFRLRPSEHIRGTRLLTPEQVRAAAALARRETSETVAWAGVNLPEYLARGHFLIAGAVASGKTVLLRLLLASVLSQIRPGSDRRALIYDAKADMVQIIAGMRPQVPVHILNPFDLRSCALDLASVVTSPAVALQTAANFIQEEKDGVNAFFIKAARDLMAATFIALHLTRPGNWNLADVVLTLSDAKRTKQLLNRTPQTSYIAREHFERDPRVLSNVLSTLSAHASMIRPVAAMWSRAPRKINLAEWVKGESILILGNDESLRAPMDAVNRVILQFVTELVLAQSESNTRRTWVAIDEFQEASMLPMYGRLLAKGRTKGLRSIMCFQSIAALRQLYGEHLAHDIVGLCANKAFLRMDCLDTAKWAAEVMGDTETREWHGSTRQGSREIGSQTEHIEKRQAVLHAQIMQLAPASNGRFEGYFVTPGVGVYHRTINFAHQLRPLGRAANFVPRPPEDQYLIDDAPSKNRLDDIGPITGTGDDDPNGPFPDDDGGFDLDNPNDL